MAASSRLRFQLNDASSCRPASSAETFREWLLKNFRQNQDPAAGLAPQHVGVFRVGDARAMACSMPFLTR